MSGRQGHATPLPVLHALKKVGDDIRDARRRRRIPVNVLAQRASISRMTLNKIEKGDGGVAIRNYASVLFGLGLLERLRDIADPRHDIVGLTLEKEQLPTRIREKGSVRLQRRN